MSKPRKLLKVLAILAFLLFVVPTIIRIIVDRRIQADIAETQQQLREMNVATDLEELEAKLPDVPDAREAAERYQDAFDILIYLPNDRDYPVPIILETAHTDSTETNNDAVLAEARRHLSENGAVIDILHEAAQSDVVRFDLNESAGLYGDRKYLHDLDEAGRLVCLQAQIAALHSDSELSTQSLVTAFRMAKALSHDATYVSQVYRGMLNRRACQTLAEVLTFIDLDEAQLQRIDHEIRPDLARESYRLGINGEMVLFDTTLQQLRTGDISPELTDSIGEQDEAFTYLHWVPFGTAWFDANRLSIFDNSKSIFQELDKEYKYYTIGTQKLNNQMNQIPSYLIISRMVLPVYASAGERHLEDITYLRSAKTILAIERFRATNNTLPESLEVLAIQPPENTQDPVDGTPLNYKLESENGYAIYSVGPDLQDDYAPQVAAISDWYLRVRR